MGTFTWAFDAPSGTYKNSAISSKLRYAAIAEAKMMQFVKAEPGFGKHMGQTLNIYRWKNITVPTSAVLDENTKIPIDTLSMSSTSITIQELARGVEYTSLSQDLSKFDPESGAQKKLKDQMKLVLDSLAATAFKTAKVIFQPTSLTGGTWTTNGTPSVSALSNATIDHCGIIRDYMTDTLNVPYYCGEEYVGLASTKFLRGIKNDPNFIEWRKYIQPGDVLFKSEVGKVEGIRFVEVNNTAALSNSKGASGVLGEAVIFGDDGVAMIELQTPELRAAIPGNFGLQKAVAWYGQLAFGLVWDTANSGEARVIRVTSS